MPEVIFTGPAGRLEGRYQPSAEKNAPIAIVLHPHPQFGGTMNNKIVYDLFYMFQKRDFTAVRYFTAVPIGMSFLGRLSSFEVRGDRLILHD